MKTIKNEPWRLRGTDLEIACILDTPADSDRSPYNAAVYRAWVVGHEVHTTAYGESPAAAREVAKVRATAVSDTPVDGEDESAPPLPPHPPSPPPRPAQ